MMSVEDIVSITNASITGNACGDICVRYLLTDSRQLQTATDTLFVALRTAKNDGHKYIPSLYAKGVRLFLVQQDVPEMAAMSEAIFIKVENTLTALQQIAAAHRKLFDIPVLAITGSNGKTIVKEWISSMLRVDKKVVSSPKSYNSQIGVPLSVWQMKEGDEFAVFEAGISEPDEMSALQKIINPTVGIFTNVGTAHDEYFANEAQKTAEKLKLFTNVSQLIYCADYPQIREQLQLHLPSLRTLSWAMRKDVEADIKILSIDIRDGVSLVTATFGEQTIFGSCQLKVELPFTDGASIENAIHCWIFMLSQGYKNTEVAKRIKRLQPIEMRMEMKEGINRCFIINDFYNSDYNSFLIALDFLANQHQKKFRRIILSDILQSGRSNEDLYKDVADVLKKKGIDAIIGIGEGISKEQATFNSLQAKFFPDTESFLQQAKTEWFNDETILLKGARAFGFERISSFFQKKVHQTVFEINLNSIIHNLNVFRSLVKPSTKIMLMTKAFSYGSGSYEIAQALQYHNADYLAVAYTDEGVQLRQNGVTTPIMVMNPEEQGLDSVLQHDLEPQIYSMEMLHELLEKPLLDTEVKIHIKLNTGMNRLGFDEADIPQLLQILQSDNRIKVASILTHLATADEPENDKHTLLQLEKFDRISAAITSVLPYKILRHCLNTAGIIRFPQYQFDMVRLGIGLYGVAPTSTLPLETVGILKTVISQIHTIDKGEAVGYGRKFIAKQPSRIGVIGIGYADGYNRKLGNGRGEVLIRGKRVPIIGNVCMDMCMVDLTSVPEAKEQDEVIIFGKEITVGEIAEKLGTIPYEILTSVSARVKRIYYQE